MIFKWISNLSWLATLFLLSLIRMIFCYYVHLLLLMTKQLYKELFFNRLASQHHLTILNLFDFYLLKILFAFIFSLLNIKLINEQECEFLSRQYHSMQLQHVHLYIHHLQVFYCNFQKILPIFVLKAFHNW